MFRLDGRKVLITGASSGIGAAAAGLCGELGASLVLLDRAPIAGPHGALTHRLDVADRAAVAAAVAAAGPVDGLVVASAVCPWDEDWLAEGWDASLERVLDVNLKGTMHVVRAVLPGMIERRRGRIVLVSSLAGKSGGLIAGAHYVASKGALNAFVKWLAQQAGPHGVTANAVAPASIDTAMMAGRPVDTSRIPPAPLGHARRGRRPDRFSSVRCGELRRWRGAGCERRSVDGGLIVSGPDSLN